MALEFNPPDWLIREYLNQKNPAEQAIEGFQGALGTYATLKEQQRSRELSQEDRDIKIATLRSEGGTNAIDALNEIRQSRGKQPFGPEGGAGPGPISSSPVIDHWNQMNGEKPQAPVLGSDPAIEEFNQIGSQEYSKKYGNKGMGKVKTALDIQKGLQDKTKQKISIAQYKALQSGDDEELAREFPDGIPENLATAGMSAQSRNVRVMVDPNTGELVRVPVSSGGATPVNPGAPTKSPTQEKLTPVERKDWEKEVNDFDSDSVVKGERTTLALLNNIERELKNYNPALTGAMASQQARAIAKEVGTLNEGDISRAVPDPSVLGRFRKAISIAWTGKLPQDQLDLIRNVVKTVKEGSSSRLNTVAQERAGRKSKQYGGKMTADELLKSLELPTNFSSGGGGLSPEKKARLEELRSKRDAGTIQR